MNSLKKNEEAKPGENLTCIHDPYPGSFTPNPLT